MLEEDDHIDYVEIWNKENERIAVLSYECPNFHNRVMDAIERGFTIKYKSHAPGRETDTSYA